MTILLTLLGLSVLVAFFSIHIYNGLVRKLNLVEEGWSGIETQLKRRADLIPNLIETVKGYAGHERTTLDRLTQLRSRSMQVDSISERAETERQMTTAIGNIMAVAENYPDLKANQNFLALQSDLTEIENQVQLARRYYNGTVRNLNIQIQTFPSNLVASSFHFTEAEYFVLEGEADRAVPRVQFDTQSA